MQKTIHAKEQVDESIEQWKKKHDIDTKSDDSNDSNYINEFMQIFNNTNDEDTNEENANEENTSKYFDLLKSSEQLSEKCKELKKQITRLRNLNEYYKKAINNLTEKLERSNTNYAKAFKQQELIENQIAELIKKKDATQAAINNTTTNETEKNTQREILRDIETQLQDEQAKLKRQQRRVKNINKKIMEIQKDKNEFESKEKKQSDIENIVNRLLDTGLYEKYCPYAYACEFIQNKYGKVQNIPDDIQVNEFRKYQYNRSQNFQYALQTLANALPNIYHEIIDDIYDKYSKYPSFDLQIDTDSPIKIITYTEVEPGTGNYIYNKDTKNYEFHDKGNFICKTENLNAPTRLQTFNPVTRYIYDEEEHRYKKHPQGDYIYVMQSPTGSYTYNANTDSYVEHPQGKYTFTKKEGQGDYIYNTEKKQYIYKPGEGDYVRVKATKSFTKITGEDDPRLFTPSTQYENNNNLQNQLQRFFYSKNDEDETTENYHYDQATQKWELSQKKIKQSDGSNIDWKNAAKELIQNQYYDNTGHINPIIVTYIKDKYYNDDKQFLASQFFDQVHKYANILQIIDHIDTKHDILSKRWKKDAIALQNKSNLTLDDINDYIDAHLANKNQLAFNRKKQEEDTSRFNQLYSKHETLIDSAKFLKKYNYDIYKNANRRIDPIMMAWATFYHIYNAARKNYYNEVEPMLKEIKQITTGLNEKIQNLKSTILQEIKQLPPINTINNDEKNKLISEILNQDTHSMDSDEMRDKYYQQARIQNIRKKYQQQFDQICNEIQQKKENIYKKQETEYKPQMNQLLHAFYNQVIYFGEQIDELLKQQDNSFMRRILEKRSRWYTQLYNILNNLDQFIQYKKYRNFNPAFLVDLLENYVNKYGGGTTDFNQIDKNDFRELKDFKDIDFIITTNNALNAVFKSPNIYESF